MRLIDAGALEKEILSERNKIPELLPCAPYELSDVKPNKYAPLIRAGIRKALRCLSNAPTVDAVPVVRCKECKWFVPKHIQLPDGTTREYTQEEKELPLGVLGDVGINCGSRCMRHSYWEINRIPVWVQENDFCSYGERKEVTP